MVHIAFSWDDGATEDLRLSDLCVKYLIPGMFFIPAVNEERPVMSESEIKSLAGNGFEIGAHTYSHKYLTLISDDEAEMELYRGKDYLEQITGSKVIDFCFPGGKYASEHLGKARKIYSSVRTADTGSTVSIDQFLVKPAFHFFNRGRHSLYYNSLKNRSVLFPFFLSNYRVTDYFDLIRQTIDNLANSNSEHRIIIWGHSWELEEFALWSKLEEFFRFITAYHPASLSGYSGLIRSS